MMASHPIYLPSATIQPGNTSYRAGSPTGWQGGTADEGPDLGLPEHAFARKIEREIGLNVPTDAELQADNDVLLHFEKKTPKEAQEAQAKIMDSLRSRLWDLARSDRFKATNAYSNISQPLTTFNPHNYNSSGPMYSGSAVLSHHDGTFHARHFALPAEKPMEVVSAPRPPDEISELIKTAIAHDSSIAESARNDTIDCPDLTPNAV